MKSLVGYTGFVGSNLAASRQFDGLYNSKNIESAFGTCPDILFYAGVPRQKFIANKYPEEDMKIIMNAVDNIKKINPKNVVLISTVDVYQEPSGCDEDSVMDTDNLLPYGKNRLEFERIIREEYPESLIVRLPGLYGLNLKKNFIFDYIRYIPALLTNEKIGELAIIDNTLYEYYTDRGDGFWRVRSDADRSVLKNIFKKVGFSALNFTDSRGDFQYYNLKFLYRHIEIALENNIRLLNVATEPVKISDIYKKLTGEEFVNYITDNPPRYDFRTKYAEMFSGENGYILSRDFVLDDIKKFVEENI